MRHVVRKSLFAAMVLFGTGLSQAAVVFTDTTKVNVLRQFNTSLTNAVTSSVAIANASSLGVDTKTFNGSDGPSGAGGWGSTSSWTETITLPGARTVGSYRLDWLAAGFRPANFRLEGKRASDGLFVDLVPTQTTNVTGHDAATFAAQTVTQVRYTASGQVGGNTTMLTSELSVYMTAGQTVPLYSGYNFMADPGVVPGGASRKESTVVGGTQWKGWTAAPNTASVSTDNSFDNSGFFRVQSDGTNNQRGYLAYSFASPTNLHMMSVGLLNGNTWPNWEIYTANTNLIPLLDTLPTADAATLQAAGWTLQRLQVTAVPVGATGSFSFVLDHPGMWQYFLVVKSEADDGNPTEFELFDVPEPTGAAVIGLAGMFFLRRRARDITRNGKGAL